MLKIPVDALPAKNSRDFGLSHNPNRKHQVGSDTADGFSVADGPGAGSPFQVLASASPDITKQLVSAETMNALASLSNGEPVEDLKSEGPSATRQDETSFARAPANAQAADVAKGQPFSQPAPDPMVVAQKYKAAEAILPDLPRGTERFQWSELSERDIVGIQLAKILDQAKDQLRGLSGDLFASAARASAPRPDEPNPAQQSAPTEPAEEETMLELERVLQERAGKVFEGRGLELPGEE